MRKKPRILIICGLTASGKTNFALRIAKKLGPTSIISVDSRQAYQGLPILTGQDIPPSFTRHQSKSCHYQQLPGIYFSNGLINIYGVDQVPPTKDLNISDFTKFVWQIIKKETLASKKIIIVGGTGLYLKAITKPMLNIHSGFTQKLRKSLSKLSTKKLQEKLKQLSAKKFKQLNHSDQLNPRRLIRAIEILKNPTPKKPTYLDLQKSTHFRWVGLGPNITTLEKNIQSRVQKRLKNKVVNEVEKLRSLIKNKKSPIYSALGLTPILKYKDNQISKKELIDSWVKLDLQFSKRQQTWFKKQTDIIWYDQNSNQKKLIQDLSLWLKK